MHACRHRPLIFCPGFRRGAAVGRHGRGHHTLVLCWSVGSAPRGRVLLGCSDPGIGLEVGRRLEGLERSPGGTEPRALLGLVPTTEFLHQSRKAIVCFNSRRLVFMEPPGYFLSTLEVLPPRTPHGTRQSSALVDSGHYGAGSSPRRLAWQGTSVSSGIISSL